jgi:hypothetical protein
MEFLVSTFQKGHIDSLSISDLSTAFSNFDANEVTNVSVIMSVWRQLSHCLTVLMIKNCCEKAAVCDLIELVKNIRQIKELEFALFNDVEFGIALDRLVVMHDCVLQVLPLLSCATTFGNDVTVKVVDSFRTNPCESTVLGVIAVADKLSVEDKSAIVQEAINIVDTADSGLLFALTSLIVRCKGMAESQVLSHRYANRHNFVDFVD